MPSSVTCRIIRVHTTIGLERLLKDVRQTLECHIILDSSYPLSQLVHITVHPEISFLSLSSFLYFLGHLTIEYDMIQKPCVWKKVDGHPTEEQ